MQTAKTKPTTLKSSTKPPKLKDCPYCKSELTVTEKDFFPCSCTFQACVNCYEDILHNNGLCPSCHKPLRVSRVKALHVSKKEELQKFEMENVCKDKQPKKSTTTTVVTTVSAKHPHHTSHTQSIKSEPRIQLPKMSFAELTKLRIIQRNLVYVIGLAPQIAKAEILEKFEYFGQYGKITKIVVNKGNVYNSTSPNGPSFSAYITFSKEIEASVAILAADQFVLFDRTIRTSYGTTKYCTFLLKGQACPNPDCLYLHSCELREELLIKVKSLLFSVDNYKDEMMSNKEIFMDQQKLTIDFIEKHYDEVMGKSNPDKVKTALPSLTSVQNKIRRLLDQRAKEKQIEKEQSKEREEDKIKNSGSNEENNKENVNSNLNLSDSAKKIVASDTQRSNPDIGSVHDSLSPTKNTLAEESKTDYINETSLNSLRSSSSNWSTTDAGLKKDAQSEQKDEKLLEVKTAQVVKSEEENRDQDIEYELKQKNIFYNLMESTSNDNKGNNEEKEKPYKDNFDKIIFEKLTRNIGKDSCKYSRFHFTQEESPEDDHLDTKQNELDPKDLENEEFSGISKSITEFITNQSDLNEAASESAQSAVDSKTITNSSTSQNKSHGFEIDSAKLQNTSSKTLLAEGNLNDGGKGLMVKAKSDKAKDLPHNQSTNKPLSKFATNHIVRHVNEPTGGASKHTVNKSVEYAANNRNKIESSIPSNLTHTHTRHNKSEFHKLSSLN